jgi:hypothetical protein
MKTISGFMLRYTSGLFGPVGLAGAFAYSSEVPPLILIQIRHLKYLKAAADSKRILG